MSFGNTMNEKVIPIIMKFINLKAVQALKDGILYTLPLNIIGSIFLLIACFPWEPFTNACAKMFGDAWNEPLFKVQNATMNIIAIITVMGIAYVYAKNEGYEAFAASVIALVVFLVTTPSSIAVNVEGMADPVIADKVIPLDWTGGKGMIAAIIIGMCVGAFYTFLLKKDIKIKMPEGVPAGVVNAFSALIPAVIMFVLAILSIYYLSIMIQQQ